MRPEINNNKRMIVKSDDLGLFFEALKASGYELYGPTVANNAIIYDRIKSVDNLPVGFSDRQDGGSYQLVKNDRPALFDYVVGQHSWKKFLHQPESVILETTRNGSGFEANPVEEKPVRRALIGVRSCELHALAIQDKILMEGPYADAGYRARRRSLFIVAVNCTRAGGTCFCDSMKTGPRATFGFDLSLTEQIEGNGHYFVVETGTEAGTKILGRVPNRPAAEEEIKTADKAVQDAAGRMGRKLNTDGLKDILWRNFDSPHWSKVAARCLTCGNCTLVCPTCFCSNVEDSTDLSGGKAWRQRQWDSCFTVGFSYIHGGSIRVSDAARYRQWLMHKLSYWPDQFGTFGCVGCGRCITWCPVGIDITEEARLVCEGK